MGFFTNFFNAISNVAQGKGTDFGRNTGAAIQNIAESVRFNEPTRVDNFLLGPNQSVNPKRDYFQEGQDAFKRDSQALADMRDPMGERTDPNTGRSVRETRGYEDKSTGSIVTSGKSGGGSSTPAAATKTEPTPPAAPKDVSEDDTSSGALEDEAIAMKKKGKKATILTSAKGLLSDAPTRPERKLKGLIA
jgi:hypothetical protein